MLFSGEGRLRFPQEHSRGEDGVFMLAAGEICSCGGNLEEINVGWLIFFSLKKKSCCAP